MTAFKIVPAEADEATAAWLYQRDNGRSVAQLALFYEEPEAVQKRYRDDVAAMLAAAPAIPDELVERVARELHRQHNAETDGIKFTFEGLPTRWNMAARAILNEINKAEGE